MTGPYESVIGCDKDSIIKRMKTGVMTPFLVAESVGQLRATLLTFNDQNQCIQIERICIDPDHSF